MNACRWNGREQPRTINARHNDQCTNETCRGCLECTEPHCRICIVTHTQGTCAECLAETREALHAIARMTDALPAEVEHRGVEGEAMMLLGPVADPEARGHLEASFKAGRIPPDALESSHVRECEDPTCAGCARELHPEFVCLSWQMVWREALDHDEAPDSSLETAVDYLDRNLTYMGSYPYASFEDFARDVRRCNGHLEAVLHDGEQIDRGAPCMRCGSPLQKCWKGREMPWSKRERRVLATEDGWACGPCRRWHNDQQYRLAVKNLHREEAEWLTDRDMEVRTGVKAGTVRSWAREGSEWPVRKRRDTERTVYLVADVLTVAKDKGLVG